MAMFRVGKIDERGCLRGSKYAIYEQPYTETTMEKPTLANPALEKGCVGLVPDIHISEEVRS